MVGAAGIEPATLGLEIRPEFAHQNAPRCSMQRNQGVTDSLAVASCTGAQGITKPTATKTATATCGSTAEQLTLNLLR